MWSNGTVPAGTLVGRAAGGSVAALTPAQAAYLMGPDVIDSGEIAVDRRIAAAAATTASGTLKLTYFTAKRSESITNLASMTHGTAAAATPTLCRMGVYEVAANGDLTLVASCASDTSLYAATYTRYERVTLAPWAKVAGRRYAAGVLVVSSVAVCNFLGATVGSTTVFSTSLGVAPRLSAQVTGLSDLPATIAAGSLTADRMLTQMEMLP